MGRTFTERPGETTAAAGATHPRRPWASRPRSEEVLSGADHQASNRQDWPVCPGRRICSSGGDGSPSSTMSIPAWPDLSDEALEKDLYRWLGPYLDGLTSLAQIRRIDLRPPLETLLTWQRRQELDRLMPTHLTVPSGSHVRLDYEQGETPVLAVRLAGNVRLSGDAADCGRQSTGHYPSAVTGRTARAGHERFGELLALSLPRGEERTARALSAAPLAR